VKREERLGAAMGFAIVAVWFHVALSLMFAVGYANTPGKGGLAFLAVLWGAAYVVVAIGLQRRHPDAKPWGIALSALACGMAFAQGEIGFSTQLLILAPLLWARPTGQRVQRYSPPPALEEGVTPYERRRVGVRRAPWD
jgi:hypothetical protein